MRKAPHGRWPCRIGAALLLAVLPQLAFAINCQVRLTPINFGTYIPLTTTPVDVNASITIRCMAQPGTYAVTIGAGLSGDQLARTLSAGGANVLFYNLYRDAARMQIWGDGAPPTFTVIGTRSSKGRPTETNHPIYGRIFPGQAPDPGSYTDNLLVTVMF